MADQTTVFVIHPMGQIFNIPCVPNIADWLGRDGRLRVHFVAIKSEKAPPGEFGPGVAEVSWSPYRSEKTKASALTWFFGYTAYAWSLIRREGRCVILAVGLRGLFVGFLLHLLTWNPMCYYSLEFYPGSKPVWRRVARFLESLCLSGSRLLILHDETRLRLYEQIKRRRFANVVYFPNAPLRSESTAADASELTARLGLAPDKKYILYSGGLSSRSFPISTCIATLDRLGAEWGIVFQTHDGRVGMERGARFDEMVKERRIILNETPLSVKDYNALVRLARIGLAMYSTTDDNMKNVALSSGKIGSYWIAGLPVIVNRIPFYDVVCPQYKSGAVFDSADEIADLVRRIDEDYDAYRQGALDCFDRFFDEARYVPALVSAVEAVAKR